MLHLEMSGRCGRCERRWSGWRARWSTCSVADRGLPGGVQPSLPNAARHLVCNKARPSASLRRRHHTAPCPTGRSIIVQLLRSRQVRTAVAAAAGLMTVIGSLVVGVPAASAATAPPAASQLQVVHRTDHSLTIKFAVPAAYYHPGAGAVVRITRGYTPAATPGAGYSVGSIDSAHEAQAGPNPPLRANLAYTFAVWIRDSGVYSKRATITTATLKDTTAPDSVSYLTSQAALAGGQPRVVLTWQNPCCDTLGPVRIVRNTKPT